MTKHAPGPWVRNKAQTMIVDAAGDHVVDLVGVWEGDAVLIEAAPDLLAACEEALIVAETAQDLEGDRQRKLDPEYLDQLRDAIAKARGES